MLIHSAKMTKYLDIRYFKINFADVFAYTMVNIATPRYGILGSSVHVDNYYSEIFTSLSIAEPV